MAKAFQACRAASQSISAATNSGRGSQEAADACSSRRWAIRRRHSAVDEGRGGRVVAQHMPHISTFFVNFIKTVRVFFIFERRFYFWLDYSERRSWYLFLQMILVFILSFGLIHTLACFQDSFCGNTPFGGCGGPKKDQNVMWRLDAAFNSSPLGCDVPAGCPWA